MTDTAGMGDAELLRALAAWLREAELSPGLADLGPWSREAVMLRRLAMAPNPGLAPVTALAVGLDLLAELRARAGPTRLAVFGGGDPRTAEFARFRFGALAPLNLMARAEDALSAARAGAVGVLSLDGPAWWGRPLAEPRLRVFAALPVLASQGPVRALAVAEVQPSPSGDDMTFWVTDAGGAASAVANALSLNGVAASLAAEAGGLKLFALAGFYQEGDPRLARAPGRLSGVIGAAPAPLPV
ncbi:MAG: chorismate mutase [Caulobacterales bacterium]